MLNQDQFIQYCHRLGLSETARAVLNTIRNSPPVRKVRSSRNNVSVSYPSRKMEVTIQAESHRNELAFIYEMEHDDEVLEYYDQPSVIKLKYQAKSGRKVGVLHTLDFFVLRLEAAGWVECKTESDLQKLAEEKPHRYVWDEADQWRCPPGEHYAEQFGLYYQVWSSAETDWIVQRNLIFLQDYFRADCLDVGDAALEEIRQLVGGEPGLKLKQLLQSIQQATSDDIYRLIVTGQIYADLQAAPLPEPNQVRFFCDQWTAQAFIIIPETLAQKSVGGFQNVSKVVFRNVGRKLA